MKRTSIDLQPPPTLLSTLAHPQRWLITVELARSDRRVGELREALNQPANLVSYHLRKLREQQLVHERRSSSDARDVYYSLDLNRIEKLFIEAGKGIHPALGESSKTEKETNRAKSPRVRVLFLCTHNSARSQMAEGVLRAFGGDLVEVESAGTQPSRVHPLAIETMAKHRIDIAGHRSKSMDELTNQPFDYVITVCDNASESCPVFPGAPERIHWSIADPTAVQGTKSERRAAFESAANDLIVRIRYLLVFVERRRGEAAPVRPGGRPTASNSRKTSA